MSAPTIRAVRPSDYERWLVLWDGYNTFYRRTVAPEVTQNTWNVFLNERKPLYAMVAEDGGELVGLVHFLFHRNTNRLGPVCYLEDLFTLESRRGQGIGRALIEAVYGRAKDAGSERVYWHTQQSNEAARKLYDSVATCSDFLFYYKNI